MNSQVLEQQIDVTSEDAVIWWPVSSFGRFTLHLSNAVGARTDGVLTLVYANDRKSPHSSATTFSTTLGMSSIIDSCYAFVGLLVTTRDTGTWKVSATICAQEAILGV